VHVGVFSCCLHLVARFANEDAAAILVALHQWHAPSQHRSVPSICARSTGHTGHTGGYCIFTHQAPADFSSVGNGLSMAIRGVILHIGSSWKAYSVHIRECTLHRPSGFAPPALPIRPRVWPGFPQSITAGCIFPAADATAQIFDTKGEGEGGREPWDLARTLRWLFFGFAVQAPWNHVREREGREVALGHGRRYGVMIRKESPPNRLDYFRGWTASRLSRWDRADGSPRGPTK